MFSKDVPEATEEQKEEVPKRRIRESSLAFIGVNVAKNSLLFTEGGDSWDPSFFPSKEEVSTEPMERSYADEHAMPLTSVS